MRKIRFFGLNRSTEYNCRNRNTGFTLVEVLIAVVILAIASIPIIRAFSVAANSSGKAKIKMRATNVAENIMEDAKGMTIDDIAHKYGGVDENDPATPNIPGGYGGLADNVAYEYQIASGWSGSTKADEEIEELLSSGYKATITIDPSYYPNINAINMADFDTVSSNTAAIFSLSELAESEIYKEFDDRNKRLKVEFANKDADWFKENLKREIRVDIDKLGTVQNSDGEDVDNVKVTISVSYYIDEANVVPDGMETKKAFITKAFDNTSTGNRLSAIFIMYPPRYSTAADCSDIIIVHNRKDVETNLYILAQDANTESDEWKDYTSKDDGGLILHIYENPISDEKEPITLFTNLHDKNVDYKKDGATAKGVKCFINLDTPLHDPEGITDKFNKTVYNKLSKARKPANFENADTAAKLDARDTDGRKLDATKADDKIYNISVKVEKEVPDDWPVTVTLDGTMVQDVSKNKK